MSLKKKYLRKQIMQNINLYKLRTKLLFLLNCYVVFYDKNIKKIMLFCKKKNISIGNLQHF